MDKTWINELTSEFHEKICEIVSVWLEIGVANEKFITRSNSLKQHVNSLLNDMIEEERRHKYEVEKSVENLISDIQKLCSDLKIEFDYDSKESLVKTESNLLKKKMELAALKEIRMKKFHTLLDFEDKLCERLYEYKLNLDPNLIPTEYQLETLQKQINELERIKKNRTKDFLLKRGNVIHYFTILEKNPPVDAFVESIYNDENASYIPLSIDFLGQCDRLINKLKVEYQKNIDECTQLRQRYEKLRSILSEHIEVPEHNAYASKSCDNCSYKVLNTLRNDVAVLEKARLEKIGEFAKNYQLELLEKLYNNFSSHLEHREYYTRLLNTEDVNEALILELEAELDRWAAIERKLEPLKELMNTWETLFRKLIDINVNLKNPTILKNRGGILLKVEKEKNAVKKDLPKCEAKIREMLSSLNEYSEIDCCDLRMHDKKLDEYMMSMWDQVDGEKENERKERKLKPASSKLDIARNQNQAKKPLQTSQQRSFGSNKSQKANEFKKPEIAKYQSKIPLKKNLLSPITKSNPVIKTNLDRRFSKSYNCLTTKSNTMKELTSSTGNLYDLFCKNVKGAAVTSSFVEHRPIRKN